MLPTPSRFAALLATGLVLTSLSAPAGAIESFDYEPPSRAPKGELSRFVQESPELVLEQIWAFVEQQGFTIESVNPRDHVLVARYSGDPRPFLEAVASSGLDLVARFVGDFRASDREWAEARGLGDLLELVPYAPRSESLRLQRDSEALLLLVPDADGRGRGVLSGKVFEYLAAGRPILAVVPPDGAAAELVRETGAGVVVAPDDVDGMRAALANLHGRFLNGGLGAVELPEDVRDRLSRRARVEEMADLLRKVAA